MRDADDIIHLIRRAFLKNRSRRRTHLFNRHCCECVDVSTAYGRQALDGTSPLMTFWLVARQPFLTAIECAYYLPLCDLVRS